MMCCAGGAVRGCSCLRSALPLAKARTAPINIIVHSTLLVQLRQLHPLSKCSNVLVCKVIKKVSFLQSPFVVIRRLLSPIPYAVRSDSVRRPIRFRPPSDRIPYAARSDSVRRPPHNDAYISPESLPYSPDKAAATE